MSDAVRLQGAGWAGDALTADAKARHLKMAETRFEEMQRYGRASRRLGLIVGFSGMMIGLAGIGLAASLLPLKQTVVRYVTVSEQTGEIAEAAGPADAPRLFSEGTARQYLRAFVEACDGYLFETAAVMAHRCAIMLTPEQQNRFNTWFTARNPESPQAVYGRGGSVRPERFRFVKFGDGRADTQVWQVRYVRVEMRDGNLTRRPWAMTVQFQWRPQLAMSDDDRSINLAGFQALDFVSQPDAAP